MKRLLVLLIILGLFLPAPALGRAWSDLTALTTVAGGDYLAIVDVSATPDIQKKITWVSLMAAPGAIGGTTPAAGAFTTLTMSTSLTLTDDDWIGLGAAKGRIEFDDQATDEVNILGANVGIGTGAPAGTLHAVLSAGKPAIFGGDVLATVTGVTGTDAAPTVLTVATTNGIVANDFVIIIAGTNATVGTYICVSRVVDTSITLDRNASSGGAISAATVKYVTNAIVIETSSGGGEPRIVLPSGSGSGIAFGDADTKIIEDSANVIGFRYDAYTEFIISATGFKGRGGALMVSEAASATVPVFRPFNADSDTGIGYAGADQLSLIAGATEGLRIVEVNSVIYNLLAVTEVDSQTDETSTSDTNLTSSATASYKVEDAVLVWSGTTAADYGLYYITAIPDGTNITIDTALTASNADVDYYVLRGGTIITPANLLTTSNTTANSYTTPLGVTWTAGADMTSGGSNGIYSQARVNEDVQNVYSLRGRMDLRNAAGNVAANQLHAVDALINLDNGTLTVTDNVSVMGAAMHSVGITALVAAAGATGGTLNLYYGVWGPSMAENLSATTIGMQILTHANTYLDYGFNVNNSGTMVAGLHLENHASNSPASMTAGILMTSAASKITYGIDMDAAGIVTAEIRGSNGETISNVTNGSWTYTGFVDASTVAGITATNPGNQLDNVLTASVNEISVCGTADDGVTLPEAVAGRHVKVINNGAQQLEIWPYTDDNAGAGANTAITLAAGSNLYLSAYNAVNWEVF